MLKKVKVILLLFFMGLLSTSLPSIAQADASPVLLRWRAAQQNFSDWTLQNIEATSDGRLRLIEPSRRYQVRSELFLGEATSPIVENLSFQEVVASWNAQTPDGTWMDLLVRVREGEQWSEWFYMGIWTASSEGSVLRHSVTDQQDALARVSVDTLLMQSQLGDAIQLKVRLQSERSGALPTLRNVSLLLSHHANANPTLSSGDATQWNSALPVPACSQFAYADGNQMWSSPVSVAMVLRYWAQRRGEEIGTCESWVRNALSGVYDHVYGAYGNWPFNIAYATSSTEEYEGYVTRLIGLDEAEPWVTRGVPLILSLSWDQGELDGAPLSSSVGHLLVLSGFDATGNPIVHDPGGPSDSQVQYTYRRDQFERAWLSHSGGVAYVIAPSAFFEPAVTPASTPMLQEWKANQEQFSSWQLSNVQLNSNGGLQLLLPAENTRSSSQMGSFSGEATSPIIENLSFQEAIASWNAQAPSGTWLELSLRVRANHEWSQWYEMGVWTAASDGTIRRHSIANQQDEMARIAVDTLVMQTRRAEGMQVRLRLYSEQHDISPVISNLAVALSDHAPATVSISSGDSTLWDRSLDIPACSQMAYPDGGEIWCSPTSVSMVLRYWAQEAGQDVGDCETWVRAAVDGVYDYVYDGHGNWPFNVAYASTKGMEGHITRLSGLDEAETWIAKGVPLIVSLGWNAGELDNAPLDYSTGHLAVLSGFDAQGNPIVHDPAGYPNEAVKRTYRRDQFERLWLTHSAGTTYIIQPPTPPVSESAYQVYIPLIIAE